MQPPDQGGRRLMAKDVGRTFLTLSVTTKTTSRVIRWTALSVAALLAARGAFAVLLDIAEWGIADEELRYVAQGTGWTAFERCIDYRFIADRDTTLYLARSADDKSTWFRIAPTDTTLSGPMVWVTPQHLRVPASYRDGCLRSLDNVVIEWAFR